MNHFVSFPLHQGYERETNKLKAVIDHNNTTVEYGDLKKGQDYDAANPVVDNYQYDEIGNLIKDEQEGITNISWTVYGKVEKVEKMDGTILSFEYDAAGNRICKREQGNGQDRITYYVRDASGNVMANYVKDNEGFKLTEQPIYGSDRIGQRQETVILAGASSLNEVKRRSVGLKVFELKNHLGNVLATVSDRRDKDGNAVVLSASDYYPFGMQMPNVNNVTGNRYGFNGKEKDTEGLGGGGSTYDYGFRIYNAQIGKFLSVDPLTKGYPMLTPYQFASNRPIDLIDIDGLEGGVPPQVYKFGYYIEQKVENTFYVMNKTLESAWNGMGSLFSSEDSSPKVDGISGAAIKVDVNTNEQGSTETKEAAPVAPWMPTAQEEIGQQEIKGSKHNSRIIEYHATTGEFKDDETAWCSSFVNWVMEEAGYEGTGSARALSWKDWGSEVEDPVYGAIAVIDWGGGKGHVGFVTGVDGDEVIVMLGGNQSDQVKESRFKKSVIVSYRIPSDYTPPADNNLDTGGGAGETEDLKSTR